MSRIACLLLCSLLTTSLAATSTRAASVLGDEFQVSGTAAGDSIDPTTGIAGSADPRDFDINVTLEFGDVVRVGWFDEDSFDVVVESGSSVDATITLSDLDFQTMSGAAAEITGVTFDPSGNAYSSFFQSDDNPFGSPPVADPTINWTSDSITVEFGSDWGGQLIADQPILRFDVEAVPEPNAVVMLLTSLVSLPFFRRRLPLNG